MKTYRFTLKSDSGRVRIRTVASSLNAAIHIICTAELCPESAILKIEIFNK